MSGHRVGEDVLALDGVGKRYGAVTAVRALSLRVAAGELLAVVGPSGCGKSTALRLIAGLERPDEGAIRLAGRPVADRTAWVPAERRRVGVVFQDHALFPHLRVADNVAFGLVGLPAERRRARVLAALELVGLDALAARYPHEISGGEQQRVALARALAPEPAVLVLDEPFSHLDPQLRDRVRAETIGAVRETGITAVLVTHDQPEALAVGERVAVMREGSVVQVGAPEDVFHRPVSHFVATFLGEADFLPVHGDGDVVHTEIGPVPADGPLPPGRHEVLLRPQDVTLRPDPAGTATVLERAFLGGFVRYTVRLGSGRTLRSVQPDTTQYRPGERVVADVIRGRIPALLPTRASENGTSADAVPPFARRIGPDSH